MHAALLLSRQTMKHVTKATITLNWSSLSEFTYTPANVLDTRVHAVRCGSAAYTVMYVSDAWPSCPWILMNHLNESFEVLYLTVSNSSWFNLMRVKSSYQFTCQRYAISCTLGMRFHMRTRTFTVYFLCNIFTCSTHKNKIEITCVFTSTWLTLDVCVFVLKKFGLW